MTPYTSLERVVAPSIEPITLTEAKTFLRLDNTADDATINRLIAAARAWIEESIQGSLITQTWRLWTDAWLQNPITYDALPADWESDVMILPRGPVQSVSAIKVIAENDAETTLSNTLFIIDTARQPARIVPRRGASISTVLRRANGVKIDYITGYGPNATDVPAPLRQAMLHAVAFGFQSRQDFEFGMPDSVWTWLQPYRRHTRLG